MKTLPNTIGKLMHLKYLDLSHNEIEVLPSSITRLVNLQTLKLSHCTNLKELPANIQKLVSLKDLNIKGCENLTHMPRGFGQLTSLQTLNLSKYAKLSELLVDIQKMVSLKHLDLEDCENLTHMPHGLGQLTSLQTLKWNPEGDDNENSMDSLRPHESLKSLSVNGYMGVRVSSWLSFLTNLVDLSIFNCKKCQYLPPLYQLSNLRSLYIWGMDGLEYMTDGDMNDGDICFTGITINIFPIPSETQSN